jgi:hypothetical protein
MDGGTVILPFFCKLLPMITGQEVGKFSQKAVGNDPTLPQFARANYNPAMIGGI